MPGGKSNSSPVGTSFLSHNVGLYNVGSYQVSSEPFLTSSIIAPASLDVISVEFPKVTKFIVIRNLRPGSQTSAPLRFGFSENGVGRAQYITLFNDESFTADYKVTKMFIRADIAHAATGAIYAGMTGIPASQLTHNWTGSKGVG
tara:strand:- start:979 stop:1413 length:435 start_codon:yes stop_codon:yes gene_type:complete